MGKKNLKFYLAHPFNSRDYVQKWADEFKKDITFKIINPFYPQRVYESYDDDDQSEDRYYKKLNHSKIVKEDLKLIRKSNGLIGIIDGEHSYGTIQEIVYAHINKKMVYLIVTNGHHNHPWLRYHADKIFKDFKGFEKWAKKNL